MSSNELDVEKRSETTYEKVESESIAEHGETSFVGNEPDSDDGVKGLDYKYAGFWMRFWAYLLDIIIIGSIDRILVYPIFRLFDWPLGSVGMFAPVSIITAIIFYAYFVLMTKYLGQTLGKMVFGLKVISLTGTKAELVNGYV